MLIIYLEQVTLKQFLKRKCDPFKVNLKSKDECFCFVLFTVLSCKQNTELSTLLEDQIMCTDTYTLKIVSYKFISSQSMSMMN